MFIGDISPFSLSLTPIDTDLVQHLAPSAPGSGALGQRSQSACLLRSAHSQSVLRDTDPILPLIYQKHFTGS